MLLQTLSNHEDLSNVEHVSQMPQALQSLQSSPDLGSHRNPNADTAFLRPLEFQLFVKEKPVSHGPTYP